MEMLFFTVFILLVEVQSYKSPTVRVSPDLIRESSSVKISCETPGKVPVDMCYYYTNREEKNIKISWRCELDLTGAELIRWAAVTSHGLINISCYYTVNDTSSSLPHSPPATVKVIESPTVRVSPDLIRESSSVKISCETPNVTVNQCYFYTNREEKNIKTSWRCELDLTGAELIRWADVTSHGLINIYCYYIRLRNDTSSSPHSPHATVKVMVSPSTITEQTTTTMITSSSAPPDSTRKTQTSSSAPSVSTRETQTSVPHTGHTHSEDSRLHFCLHS
ncbi:uncharacterized protein LOC122354573 isoform X2 [Puntigrus tetrazona]|uniref:uncharacterized protein LOC122354573 isoform X2 n=1 Tax=Puntigrus tetrazona TaxID=1606681 RepID=UPI001C893874|nr:uncharacterized protein LOC122354573 isoform X2 [Puntigrus tetrazona]